MINWKPKEECHQSGKNFLIVVKHHTVGPDEFNRDDGGHRWNVYAYIYPIHPHFKKFEGEESIFQDAANALPLHCGASFLRYHYDSSGVITSVQVGSDYNHLHDDEYNKCATAEDASDVFRDAEKLHAWLTIGETT